MTLVTGTRLGSYQILALLGQGGMGQVYQAKDLQLERTVAIKVIREDQASDPVRLKRFLQEARSASALNHPNIITIHNFGKHGSMPYIAMEFVEGRTLREILKSGPLPVQKTLRYATQTAEGLAKAHSAGIVHRDLKPENLMITTDDYVKILDFGLAKLIPLPSVVDSQMATLEKMASRDGVVLGTVLYMSPEQASGRRVDYRSDQFALGSILYEMVTGKFAFKRETVAQTLTSIIEQQPQPIGTLKPEAPAPLLRIVERCHAKDPEKRFGNTGDLVDQLRSASEHLSQAPWKTSIATPSRLLKIKKPYLIASAVLLTASFFLTLVMNVGGLRERLLRVPSSAPLQSLAVLPLDNLSGDPGQEYFADGMTDELIGQLARISALRVISRTSVMQYKGVRKSLPEITRELSVDAVIEGSVRRSGNRVRINAQLIEAATDRHLWSQSYERDLSDVLTLQSDVARTIAREIRVKLTPQEGAQLTRARSVDPEAYDAYLKGRYQWSMANVGAFKRAIEYFDEAIQNDPDFAPAYAGRADAYANLELWGALPPGEGFSRAKEEASKALAKDETLAAAHVSLGHLLHMYDWDWSGAERELRRALELDWNSPDAHSRYAYFLGMMGRHDEAIAEAEEARRLDPLTPWHTQGLGGSYFLARRYETATEYFRQVIAMEPNMWNPHFSLALLLPITGSLDEAEREAQKAVALSSRNPFALSSLAYIQALKGNHALARELLRELLELRNGQHVPALAFVRIYMGLNDEDEAFEWLEKAYQERDWLSELNVHPIWDPLRSDPRFQEFLRRLNFPK